VVTCLFGTHVVTNGGRVLWLYAVIKPVGLSDFYVSLFYLFLFFY